MEINVEEYGSYVYTVFRVLVGFLFLQHGLQKFGLLGGNSVELMSMMGVAGVVELVVGVLIILGLLTQIAALLGGIQMLVAYFMVHAGNGLLPINNGGELALMFFAAFLVLFVWRGGEYSVDAKLLNN